MLESTRACSTQEAGPYFLYNSSNFLQAVEPLQKGELAAFPTETVYGLAANALNTIACRRIFTVKGRPLLDPLIVHVGDMEMARKIAEFNSTAELLADRFWPGALTLVLKKNSTVSNLITAGLDTVAIRMPSHSMAQAILKLGKLALAAPSANPFGYLSPTCIQHVRNQLGNKISHFIDGGPCQIGIESTIIDASVPDQLTLLRPGGLSVRAIEEACSIKVSEFNQHQRHSDKSGMPAPGMLTKHYSPRTPVTLFRFGSGETSQLTAIAPKAAYVYCFRPSISDPGTSVSRQTFWFSETAGDLENVAHNLFSLLHKLDTEGFEHLFIEEAPEVGIGIGINDRLRRAAAQ